MRRRIKSGYRGESLITERREQAAGGAAGVEYAGGSRRQGASDVGSGGSESSGVERRRTAASRRGRVIILRPSAIEPIIICLGGGGIGVNETATAADDDVVFGGERITVRNHELLAVANRLSGGSASRAWAMWLGTESRCAMHGPLGRRPVGRLHVRGLRVPKTRHMCDRWLRATAPRPGD